jgi:hypothetical protein
VGWRPARDLLEDDYSDDPPIPELPPDRLHEAFYGPMQTPGNTSQASQRGGGHAKPASRKRSALEHP